MLYNCGSEKRKEDNRQKTGIRPSLLVHRAS
jgi:hypothetical protein